jgi:hypothetical protein
VATETTSKIKVCKAQRKNKWGKLEVCGERIMEGLCPERNYHLRKFLTGFCAHGLHENEKVFGPSGRQLKPCSLWMVCPCECHVKFDQMYILAGMERDYRDISGYEPPKSPYVMPTLDEVVLMRAAAAEQAAAETLVIESPDPERVPPTIKRTFRETKSGRSARGELESWVKQICDEFLVEEYDVICSPAWVSEQIAEAQGVKPPSQGAVDAVFKRWERIGFAVIDRKPTRFSRYTEDGVKLGLEVLKLKAKNAAKQPASQMSLLRRK